MQIFILIISSFAFSYIIYQSSDSVDKYVTDNSAEKSESSIFSSFIKFVYNQLIREMFPSASAQVLNCCPVSKNGARCNEYVSESCSSQCNSTCQPTSCSQFSDCQLGCCYDSREGTCSANSPRGTCLAHGGNWTNSADCNAGIVQECRLRCCVLGSETAFVTSKRCEVLAASRGLGIDFRAMNSEMECILLSMAQEKGACLLQGGGCRVMTAQECVSLTGMPGNFFKDVLCTAQALNTTCQKTESTICIEGEDEVYFADSCGNPANIYDSSKIGNQSYWERVVKKNDACGANSANGNAGSKSCGNCWHVLGSKCKDYKKAGTEKPNKGENICADLNCKNAPYLVDAFGKVISTKDRRNGESWCIYDGSIGVAKDRQLSTDVVGSRHFRYSCADGEVKIEQCADFRNEICVQQNGADVNGTQVDFSSASCRVNAWQKCINANTGQASGTSGSSSGKCEGTDCDSKTVIIDKFIKSLCTPKYPEGFDLSSEQGGKVANSFCGQASATCVVKYKSQGLKGGCKCYENCGCEKVGFTQQMNDLCVSLGDCGGYVNIAGQATSDGYTVSKAPGISVEQYKIYANPVAGLFASAGDISEILAQFGIGSPSGGGGSGGGSGSSNIGMMLGGAALGAGGIAYAAGTIISWAGYAGTLSVSSIAAFANGAIIAGIGMIVGSMIAKMLGLSGAGSMLMSIGFGLAGLAIASQLGWISLGAWATPVLVIGIILILISLFFGAGKCKPKIVTFTCKPWQPPKGAADCEKCNSNTELKPCSKYRCQSLGAGCEFINEGTDKEMCVAIHNDGQAPQISPWLEMITGNYSYINISERGFSIRESNGNCIQAFTPLLFGIQTNKPAQCKVDIVSKPKYDDMEQYFGESNLYLYNHSTAFSLPSIESLVAELNDSNYTYQYVLSQIGNTRFYVRCSDKYGNINPAEYLIDICIRAGPDRTAPYITRTSPENNAFLGYNQTSREMTVWVNEPANCKYSKQDKSYSTMENSMNCLISLSEQEIFGWRCDTNLMNLTGGENIFYIRCKDQPWLPAENESQRNENAQSYVYRLRASENPLTITSISPDGSMSFGSEPIELDLVVETSGGAENGKAMCRYSFDGNNYVDFNYLSGVITSTHRQVFNRLVRGSWNVYVKCTDIAGNEAQASTTWELGIDEQSPLVTRIYNSGGSLYLYTNENSECAYSTTNAACSFIFENGTGMSGGLSQEHGTDWNTEQNYYIKCRDAWKNEPSGCSIKVRAFNVRDY